MVGLRHYADFEEVLSSYRVSDRAIKATQGLKLILLLAPTSAGKNTLIRHLVKADRYYNIVSDTTRPPRKNNGVIEQNGREYWFRTEEEMLADLKSGELLEAEIIHHQQVSGISIRELEKAQRQGKIAITDTDPKGVRNILKIKPDTIVIVLLPPSFEEWQRRLATRGEMDPSEIKRRLETARQVFKEALDNDYNFVISDDVADSAKILDRIAAGGPNSHQDRGCQLVRELQLGLNQKLAAQL